MILLIIIKKSWNIFFNIVLGLILFICFIDYGVYFLFFLFFSVYLGVVVVVFGILLCIFVGIVNGIRRYV